MKKWLIPAALVVLLPIIWLGTSGCSHDAEFIPALDYASASPSVSYVRLERTANGYKVPAGYDRIRYENGHPVEAVRGLPIFN